MRRPVTPEQSAETPAAGDAHTRSVLWGTLSACGGLVVRPIFASVHNSKSPSPISRTNSPAGIGLAIAADCPAQTCIR